MELPDIPAAMRLERYRSIVPDWHGFLGALKRPLPLCLWTNTLRTDAQDVEAHLKREGIEAAPIDWFPGAFKGPPSDRAGRCLPFVAGLYHIQEEVSLIPVRILGPRAGDRVIDLCSAPGNKTAQTAVAMRNSGTIIANDRNSLRTRATRGVLDRLGIVNTTITTADASNLPDEVGRFDRVLADVPCTCEGTSRKHPDALLQSGREASLNLYGRQTAILRKAVQLCHPGGTIVYATCTYAPEENEMVVDAILREGGVEIVPARVETLRFSPGITAWEGSNFDPALERTLRVWPDQNDSGGFFVAKLRRTGAPSLRDASSFDAALSPTAQQQWTGLLTDRFGIPTDAFDGLRLHEPNNKYVAVVAAGHEGVEHPEPVSTGMPLIRIGLRFPKLTTAGARLLGTQATRNVVHADDVEARAYVAREDFTLRTDHAVSASGYVLVEHRGATLGVGLYLEEKGTVRSMFPKVLSNAVA